MRRTIRVILDALHLCRYTCFVALEVNNAVALLVTTAAMTGSYPSSIITATRF